MEEEEEEWHRLFTSSLIRYKMEQACAKVSEEDIKVVKAGDNGSWDCPGWYFPLGTDRKDCLGGGVWS